MTDGELAAALGVGERCAQEAIERGAQLLIAGDMGIANTTSAACLICAFTGESAERVVGRGTGVDDAGLTRKIAVVEGALARMRMAANVSVVRTAAVGGDASIEARRIFAQLGGMEIAAMAGLYIEAARRGVPVLLDGFISGAAALGAVALEPGAKDWMLASHRSFERGHGVALEALQLNPLIDLGMRLGEGSGAALTLPIIQAALALHRKMATFTEAGVAGAIDGPK
jgi:nicotinate-nucleotide--dimethylbenzimidazole phosphoribosyltransferase